VAGAGAKNSREFLTGRWIAPRIAAGIRTCRWRRVRLVRGRGWRALARPSLRYVPGVPSVSPGGRAVRLEATPPLIRDRRWRREVEGSCLEWDPTCGTVRYSSAPGSKRAVDWSLGVGGGPGDLRTVVHAHGSWPDLPIGASVADFAFDVLVFLDRDEQCLVPGIDTGVGEYFGGWFPPARVRELASTVGVEFREDRVESWADLNERYPGLITGSVSRARQARATVWVLRLMAAALVVAGVVGGLLALVSGAPLALVGVLGFAAIAGVFAHQGRELRRGAGRRTRPRA
jgi:hypothetical protein